MSEIKVITQMVKGKMKKVEHSRDELEKVARRYSSAEQFAAVLMGISLKEINQKIDDAVNPKTYNVITVETGEVLTSLYWTKTYEQLEKKVAKNYPNVEVEIIQNKKNYNQKLRYETLKMEFEQLMRFYKDLGVFSFYTPIENLWKNRTERLMDRYPMYRLYQAMAEQLGAIGYKEEKDYLAMDRTWYRELGLMGRGLEFILADGKVIYLYMGIEDRTLYISQIGIRERGKGLGTKVMELFKEFMDEMNGNISVMKVCNQKFFDRFDWLTPTSGGMFYDYKPKQRRQHRIGSGTV